MGILDRLFGKKAPAASQSRAPQHAVVVYLDGAGLPAEVYQRYDLSTLEDQLRAVLISPAVGEYDGNEVRESTTVLYMYGPDSERLFATVDATLRAYPLCKNARVLIRPGPPGTPPRELRL